MALNLFVTVIFRSSEHDICIPMHETDGLVEMFGWIPDLALRILEVPDWVHVFGNDEETALVGEPCKWEVKSRQSIWVLQNGHHEEFASWSPKFQSGN